MIATSQKVLDAVIFFHFRGSFATGGTILGIKGIYGHPFDITLLSEKNGSLLIGNEINILQITII